MPNLVETHFASPSYSAIVETAEAKQASRAAWRDGNDGSRNKELVRKYPEEVLSRGNLDLIDEIIADEYVEHNSAVPEPIYGPDGVAEYVSMLRTAVPDIECGVEELIAEGDLVVRRDRGTGTLEGEFMGIEPTGEAAVVEGIHIHRIEDGKLVESWAQNDMMGLMQQLGAVKTPER